MAGAYSGGERKYRGRGNGMQRGTSMWEGLDGKKGSGIVRTEERKLAGEGVGSTKGEERECRGAEENGSAKLEERECREWGGRCEGRRRWVFRYLTGAGRGCCAAKALGEGGAARRAGQKPRGDAHGSHRGMGSGDRNKTTP